ncbi:hypothetical protein EIP91_008672 [Steccherinum ochraceum]|uniref:GED domain-containing protein n=1 Tax=Steccherinum ochraceum TaxID=92696 RepID=A0A4R0R2K1_9APHY|nr:hypothetical protein EIP91_008672 [Steccherinum ochraceum]
MHTNPLLPPADHGDWRQLDERPDASATLPRSLATEPVAFVVGLVSHFSSECQRLLNGDNESSGPRGFRQIFSDFKNDIVATTPYFIPLLHVNDLNIASVHRRDVELDDGDAERVWAAAARPVFFDDVSHHIEKSMTRELPGRIPYIAKVTFIQETQVSWKDATTDCFDKSVTCFAHLLADLVDSNFGQFPVLAAAIHQVFRELLHTTSQNAQAQLANIIEYECRWPYTQHDDDLLLLRERYMTKYKTFLRRQRDLNLSQSDQDQRDPTSSGSDYPASVFQSTLANAHDVQRQGEGLSDGGPTLSSTTMNQGQADDALLGLLRQMGYDRITLDDLEKLRLPDSRWKEMEFMADVKAYLDIASKRFTDVVPMTVDNALLRAFAQSAESVLRSELGLLTSDARGKCAEYLQ